jgi:spore germination cell wall hydrolase CwlJ-like protein
MGIQKAVVVLLVFLPTSGVADSMVECLANNIYFESRNQPWVGKIAVAQVTLNRVKSAKFPDNICAVVKQKRKNVCQFSWYCDGLSDNPKNLKEWKASLIVAVHAYSGKFPDITEDALWYHAAYMKPWWAEYYVRKVMIEDHVFYGTK